MKTGCGRLIVGEWSSDEFNRFNLSTSNDPNLADISLVNEKKGIYYFTIPDLVTKWPKITQKYVSTRDLKESFRPKPLSKGVTL